MSTRRKRFWTVVGTVFVLASLAFLGLQIAQDWDAAVEAARQYSVGGLVLAFAGAVVGLGLTGLAWRTLLAGLGNRLTYRDALSVFFTAQVGKYLPGSVWSYAAQVRLAHGLGVPASRSAQTGVTFVLLHLLTGLLIGLPRLLIGRELDARFAWALLAVPVIVVLVHPRVLARLVRLAGRLLRTDVQPVGAPWRATAGAVVWLVGAWACYGTSMVLLVAPFQSIGVEDALLLTSSYALAWSVGFLGAALVVVAAPAGLGFREAALYATLAGVVEPGAAALVVLLSRAVMTLADLVWAGLGLTSGSMRRWRQPT